MFLYICVNDCFDVWSDDVSVTECLMICERNEHEPISSFAAFSSTFF